MGSDVWVLAKDAPAYPRHLNALQDPPGQLYVRGTLPASSGPLVSIVGSREPSRDGARFAFELAAELGRHGVTVVSGGARGIDGSAHEGALSVGGSTVAVLAGDVTRPTPASHGGLFRRIVQQGGALVAEHARRPGHGGGFVVRNRLIAAWADAVVVVEARLRSGTQSTAAAAERLGRPLFAVPWSPYHRPGEGCLCLLESGARSLSSARPLLRLLGAISEAPEGKRNIARPGGEAGRLLDALERHQGASIDELAGALESSVPHLLQLALELELQGFLERGGAGRFLVRGPAA